MTHNNLRRIILNSWFCNMSHNSDGRLIFQVGSFTLGSYSLTLGSGIKHIIPSQRGSYKANNYCTIPQMTQTSLVDSDTQIQEGPGLDALASDADARVRVVPLVMPQGWAPCREPKPAGRSRVHIPHSLTSLVLRETVVVLNLIITTMEWQVRRARDRLRPSLLTRYVLLRRRCARCVGGRGELISCAAFDGSGLATLAAAALPPEPDHFSQTQLQPTSQLPQQQAGAIRLLEFSTLTPQSVTPSVARLHSAGRLW